MLFNFHYDVIFVTVAEQCVHSALLGAHIILIPTLAFRVMTATCCPLLKWDAPATHHTMRVCILLSRKIKKTKNTWWQIGKEQTDDMLGAPPFGRRTGSILTLPDAWTTSTDSLQRTNRNKLASAVWAPYRNLSEWASAPCRKLVRHLSKPPRECVTCVTCTLICLSNVTKKRRKFSHQRSWNQKFVHFEKISYLWKI